MEILAVRDYPHHPSRKEMQEPSDWFDPEFDPERFNLDEVNSLLAT